MSTTTRTAMRTASRQLSAQRADSCLDRRLSGHLTDSYLNNSQTAVWTAPRQLCEQLPESCLGSSQTATRETRPASFQTAVRRAPRQLSGEFPTAARRASGQLPGGLPDSCRRDGSLPEKRSQGGASTDKRVIWGLMSIGLEHTLKQA